jgi:hypothetical protein
MAQDSARTCSSLFQDSLAKPAVELRALVAEGGGGIQGTSCSSWLK